MLACEFEAMVYCNDVGTFGSSSASEWWARFFGADLRATYCLLCRKWPWGQLAYVDDLQALGAG